MRIAFKTFGCRANSVDTDALWMAALRRGYEVVSETESADAYIINSCTVTAGADRDARSHVRRFKRLNPDAWVAVIGCYGQVAKEELLRLTGVDAVLGTADKHRVLDLVGRREAAAIDAVSPTAGFLPETFLGSRRARAALKVQDGCNYRCSFCIIPTARGRSRSLPLEKVLEQAREAYRQGFREIVLTGIHLAHYGWDRGTDLVGLLRALLSEEGPRIRLSTLDPFEIPDELVSLFRDEERLCPYLHIALQSGSDEVLRRMRRLYRAAEFEDATSRLVAASPRIFLGVDVIVGFPGETEEAFGETLRLLERSAWTKLHVFPYSERAGTAAVELDAKVSRDAAASRSDTLLALSEARSDAFLREQLGRSAGLLLEKRCRDGRWMGHTEHYVPAILDEMGDNRREREIVPCRLAGRLGPRLIAQPL